MGRKKKDGVMSQKDQIELVKEYFKTGDLKIKEQLILEADGFIRNIIEKKFEYNHLKDDLFQEGRAAVSRAIEKFNPDLNYTLANWLYNCVYRALIDYVAWANNYNRNYPEDTPHFEQIDYLSQDEELDSQTLEKISYEDRGIEDVDWDDSINYYSKFLSEEENLVLRALLERKKLSDFTREYESENNKPIAAQYQQKKIREKLQRRLADERSNNVKYGMIY